jgi:hypothetical protein
MRHSLFFIERNAWRFDLHKMNREAAGVAAKEYPDD